MRSPEPTTSTSSTASTARRSSLQVRGPDDLLAAVPILLGFTPHRSVVVVTFGTDGGRGPGFHLRADLVDEPEHLPVLVASIVGPCRHHGVERLALIVYTDDGGAASRLLAMLRPALDEAGIEAVLALRADGRRWFDLDQPAARGERPGTAYDAEAHPARARSVLEGHVVHASREALAERLAPRPDAALDAELARAIAAIAAGGRSPRDGERAVRDERAWVERTVAAAVEAGQPLDPASAARLLLAVPEGALRDACWSRLERANARAHLELWLDLARRAPVGTAAAPAALAALAAWLCGDGALAWCGVDRSRAEEPAHPLADLVAELLRRATPPTWWDEVAPLIRGEGGGPVVGS